jgi:hypothetical protein
MSASPHGFNCESPRDREAHVWLSNRAKLRSSRGHRQSGKTPPHEAVDAVDATLSFASANSRMAPIAKTAKPTASRRLEPPQNEAEVEPRWANT